MRLRFCRPGRAIALLLSIGNSAYAAQIYVGPTTGAGIDSSDLQSTSELIRSAIPEVSSDTATDDPEKADFELRPKLIRLGTSYILTLTKVKHGSTLFSSELKAQNIEELDKVSQRLTRSVLTGERAKENPRVGEITDEEAKEGTQRRPTRPANYIGFGGASLSNLNTSGIGYSIGLNHSWDLNTVRIKLLAEGDFSGNAFFISAGLGLNYYFLPTDISPYVTADFGGGVSKTLGTDILSGQTIGGFVLGAGAGVEFFRTHSVNLDLGFRAGFMLNSNAFGSPQAYSLRLGLNF